MSNEVSAQSTATQPGGIATGAPVPGSQADPVRLVRQQSSPAFGFALSSEENSPEDLVNQAQQSEKLGLEFLSISDHFHPWVPAQGHCPAVWPVLDAIACTTDRIIVGTGVTAPIRIHPAIIAQFTATVATMFRGRFYFGVGTGEALNELVIGGAWPSGNERVARLREAITIIQKLWSGDTVAFDGSYFTVNDARLFTLPERPPQILVATGSPATSRLAAELDGLVTTGPAPELFEAFEAAGGTDKPRMGQITICWDPSEAEGRRIARRFWPTTVLGWESRSSINTPSVFEDVTALTTEEAVADRIPCGPDLSRLEDKVAEYVAAGIDHVYFHQVGTKQMEFLEVYGRELLPRLRARFGRGEASMR